MLSASYIDIMSSHFRFKLCGKSCQGENLIDYIWVYSVVPFSTNENKGFHLYLKSFECYLHQDVIFCKRVNKIGNNIDIQNIVHHFLKSVLLTFKFFKVKRQRKSCCWMTACHKTEKYVGESKTYPITRCVISDCL